MPAKLSGPNMDGMRVGAHGSDYSVFSFSPVRHITTGEGAAIAFQPPIEADLARSWRRYGIPPVGFRDSVGSSAAPATSQSPGSHNYMNRIAGALGVLQMDSLPGIVEAQRRNGAFFDEALWEFPGYASSQSRGTASHPIGSIASCASGATVCYASYARHGSTPPRYICATTRTPASAPGRSNFPVSSASNGSNCRFPVDGGYPKRIGPILLKRYGLDGRLERKCGLPVKACW